jgi:hypothetical protein
MIGIPIHFDDVSFEKRLSLRNKKAPAQRLVAISLGVQL